MNAKERLFAALNFEETDRTPVYPLDGNSWIINEEGLSYEDLFALPDKGASIFVKRYEELKSDVVYVGGSCWLAWANAFGAKINASRVGRTVEVEPCITDLETQIPDMTDEELKTLLENNYYIQSMIIQIREAKKIIGEEKALVAGSCGPFTAAGNLFGTGEFMKQIAKRNKKLPELLNFTVRVMAVLNKLYSEAGADIFFIAEPTASGDMIAPRTFKQFVVPYFKEFMAKLNEDMTVILHICGDSGNRVDFVKDLGVKAFSVDSMVNMEEMLAKADHNFCMMGSLAPSDQMVLGTPESVYKESTRLLELAKANKGGFLLSTGCDFPAGSPLANELAMVQAAEDFVK